MPPPLVYFAFQLQLRLVIQAHAVISISEISRADHYPTCSLNAVEDSPIVSIFAIIYYRDIGYDGLFREWHKKLQKMKS